MVQSMKPQVFTCCSLLLYHALISCLAIDTLHINSTTLEEFRGNTLVSTKGKFELGFFTPRGNSYDSTYLGIWYHNLSPRTVVWVANRDKPLRDSPGILAFRHDGKLQVLDESGKVYWSADTNERVEIRLNNIEAKLMDSGNFVLGYNTSTPLTPIWQSFEHHVDTLLPGMNLSTEISSKSSVSLNSWREAGDPTLGNFNFTYTIQNGINQFVIQAQNDIVPHWKSTDETGLFKSTGIDAPQNLISDILANVAMSQASDNTSWRLVMNSTGEIQYWILETQQWILKSWAPRDRCALGHGCGIFGSCNVNNKILCKCLPGFTPRYQEKWDGGDFSGGCNRNLPIGRNIDTFLTLVKMRVGDPDVPVIANGVPCREQCLNTSECQAYTKKNEDAHSDETCLIWTGDLNYLQEDYNGGADILFVRVANSSIKPTARSCDPCGTDLIPYPLSTGSNCGEPTYNRFQCDISSGKTIFTTPTGAYNVTSIEQNNGTFFVQVKEADDCSNRKKGFMDNISHLNQTLSSPFKLVNSSYWCDPKKETNGYNDMIGIDELQISWEPPPEPPCTLSSDCKDWPNSKCKLSKDGHLKQCICNTNFAWNSSALNCTEGSGKDTPVSLIVGASIGGVVVVLSCSILFCWLFRRKLTKRRGREKFQNEALMHNTEKRIKELIDSQHFTEEDGKGIDVHFFDFDSILAATDNFSNANKLGQGGFGPVYKGKFPGGQEIAIKRLSTVSGQGLEEFKNEVVLIARLQHRNLVRLLGYCLKGDEKILIYEYMHNKSLDLFLFDAQQSTLLTWEKRFDIILGVARGLLYLHQDSRLRIVHRDLKPSNILLDEEMNAKISDFGLAKMVVGKRNEGSTERVIGTFGYMSPEYRLEGVFSVKSDVFSFGVVVLEILSGKKNASYFNLLDYAWRLWKEDKIMELMEGTLSESCSHNEFLKCVNVALLCIEEHPADRPNMSNVVVLLSSEAETLPAPKKPACITRGSQNSPEPSSSFSSKHEALRNSLTMSEEGR